MFAPKVGKPQTKAAESSICKQPPQHSTFAARPLACAAVEHVRMLQRTTGNQATLRYVTQWLSNLSAQDPMERHEQKASPENMTARGAARVPPWDLGQISVFPPDRPNQAHARSSLRAPPLPDVLQAKLTAGGVNDPFEQEADRIAGHVMRMQDPAPSVTTAPHEISRKCAACGHEAQWLQTKIASSSEARVCEEAGVVRDVLRTSGQPLDLESRAYFEPRFGTDFSQVRIHADARAAESARSVHARAYTVGQHVVFGRSQYAPHTADGRHLLAHELTHTLQQKGGVAGLQRAPDPPGSSPPTRPGLEARLKVIEEIGPAAQVRLDQIIRTGGPLPTTGKAKVIGAAIIDVEGYQGPKEMRAISGADTDSLRQGASVYHASSPTDRTLSATRSIAGSGPRREFPFAHINDAEMKLFEDIIGRLPKDAKGTIHFTTVRVREVKGQTVLEPYPACSGCIRASFETAGTLPKVDLVSHAPVHPTGTAELPEPRRPAGPKPGSAAREAGGPKLAVPAPATEAPRSGVPKLSGAETASGDMRAAARSAASSIANDYKILRVARALTTAVNVIQVVLNLQMLEEFIGMAQSGMKWEGFILTNYIKQAEIVQNSASEIEAAYPGFSDSVQGTGVALYKSGADAESAAKALANVSELRSQIDPIRRDLDDRIKKIDKALVEVRAKEKAALAILEDPKASAALAAATFGTAELAKLFAASQDLSRIEGALNSASQSFHKVETMMGSDIQFLDSWSALLLSSVRRLGSVAAGK
ncbi:eCIS core domain-containing protein [Methylobacterium frigidaeris]|uniref:eCIS core domain-containing protein n=2 Tax=Methylobacterium frigidaeris TaxID=2038277 RepID=A0AA37M1P0_9HYPH|nr:DUF4157 domain-containing protein [Methylobacterium frigidaeris]GJD60233.1 hypothetical protein MPEAHAMD_0369 [Methylobacterium frigidaeris]